MKNHLHLRRAICKAWVLCVVALTPSAFPQKPTVQPSFDAVSIRASDASHALQIAGQEYRIPDLKACAYLRDRVTCRMPLWYLLLEAFHLREFQLAAPAWTKEELFEVQAVMPLDTPKETARLMLQTALIEQFGLKFHRDIRKTSVYALVPTKDGSKLTAWDPDHPQSRTVDSFNGRVKTSMVRVPGQFFMAGTTIETFAVDLGEFAGLDRPVIDGTGLMGRYLIDMKWKTSVDPEEHQESPIAVDPGVVRAMEQQLGLRLEKKDAPFEYLSIDHANRTPQE